MPALVLKLGVEKKLLNFYPWVYGDEVEAMHDQAAAGDIVRLVTGSGGFVAFAFYNPSSHIVARVLSLDPTAKIDRTFFQDRLQSAIGRRAGRVMNTDALRLVHAEADSLPGLIVDRLADVLVIQIRNPGIERIVDDLVRGLKKLVSPAGIYERSDTQARAEEGMPPRVGPVTGEVPERLDIREDGLLFEVRVRSGQKTGFYMDQRDNRRLLGASVRPGDRMLDVFSYTGGFALHAARAGAHAVAVDKDTEALQTLEINARRNGLADKVGARWGDALGVLSELSQERRSFTHVVLDPPTLAKHKNDVPRVKRIFSDLAEAALSVLEPGGLLFLSTCAYHLAVADLIEATRRAAASVNRRAVVEAITYQPPDHPWILQIPETLYLKTLVLRVA